MVAGHHFIGTLICSEDLISIYRQMDGLSEIGGSVCE